MPEVSIELCDGRPSFVENNLAYWILNVKLFCPWSTRVIKINRNSNGKTLKATLNNRDNQPLFATVHEDKGGGAVPDYTSEEYQDEYSRYDEMLDGFADQELIDSGATIIRSEIQLTDSSARNRVLVRRQDNNSQWNI